MAGSGTEQLRDGDDIVLRVEQLVMEFPAGRHQVVHAVSDLSFDVRRGETLGIVGESGCGKTTTLKVLLGLEKPNSGDIFYEGENVALMTKAGRTEFRRSVQAVFQDPWSSLNPRMRVRAIVGEPLEIATTMTKGQIQDLSLIHI